MTHNWYQKLLDEDGQRDLQRARTLEIDELREWLKAHFNGDDPSAPHGPDTDPTALFEDVWELIPGEDFKHHLSEAILLEYQASAAAPEGRVDYWAFILRLMTLLPVANVPSRDMWRRYRARQAETLRTADGISLEHYLIQTLFARGAVSLSDQKQLLKNSETANLAFKAIRDTGLGPAAAHLPDLLSTLAEPANDIKIFTHLKILLGKHGEKALVDEIASSTVLSQPVYWERLKKLLRKLQIDLSGIEKEPILKPPVAADTAEICRIMRDIFNNAGDPLATCKSVPPRSRGVWAN